MTVDAYQLRATSGLPTGAIIVHRAVTARDLEALRRAWEKDAWATALPLADATLVPFVAVPARLMVAADIGMMTPRQIDLARHALGLRETRLVSHRNHFCAGPEHVDYDDWMRMVAAGFATWRENKHLPAGDVMFHLTRAGAELALRPGDILNPEDWP